MSVTQTIRVMMDVSNVATSTQQIQRQFSGMQKTIGSLGVAFAGAFAVQNIISFGNEAIQLGSRLTNVQDAFNRLDDATLLNNLRKATRGTVTDLELMQQAISAVNLGIDKNQLATYFEFATVRARETGQSVDYLVNSIVTGVGRKSALILDNLGISTLRLSEELQKGGTYAEAVGRIIQEEMAKAGEVVETAAEKQEQLNVELKNQQALLGQQLAPAYSAILKVANSFINTTIKLAKAIKETNFEWYDAVTGVTAYLRVLESFDKIGEAERQQSYFNDLISRTVEGYHELVASGKTAAESYDIQRRAMVSMIKAYQDAGDTAWVDAYGNALNALNKEYDKTKVTVQEVAVNVTDLKERIKELQTAQETATTNEQFRQYQKQIDALQMTLYNLTNVQRENNEVQKITPRVLNSSSLGVIKLNTSLNGTSQALLNITPKLLDMIEAKQKLVLMQEQASFGAEVFGMTITDSLTNALLGVENFGQAMFKFLKQLIARLTSALVVAVALSAVLGGLGLGSGATSIGNLFKTFSGFNIPGLASGGIVTGPTLAMIGEGNESEAVLPLSKLSALINNSAGGNSSMMLSGYDLILAKNRNERRYNRLR